MHYFQSKWFCYVQVMAASLGKSHVHSTGYKVWYIQDFLGFFLSRPVQILIMMSFLY